MIESNHLWFSETTAAEPNEQPAAHDLKHGDVMTAEEIVWSIIKDNLPSGYTKSDFQKYAEKYTFVPVVIDGAVVGAYANHENEVHAAVLPEYSGRWFSKRVLRWVNDLQKKYGELTTKVELWNSRGLEFVSRLGFKPVNESNGLIYFVRHAS